MGSLRVIYEDRRQAWRARAATARRRDEAAGWGRVVASVALAAAMVMASQAGLHGGFVILAAAALAATHLADREFNARLRRAERTAAFYDAGLDRLHGGSGSPGFDGEDLVPKHHAYARHLDLVGPRSLFARLCAARTRTGASALLYWHLQPADRATLTARREAVDALRGRLDLREAWGAVGADVVSRADPAAIAAWASARPSLPGRWLDGVLQLIVAAVVAAPVGAALGWWSWWLPISALGLAALAHALLRRRVGVALASAQLVLDSLGPTCSLLRLMERETFTTPRLAALHARLHEGGVASVELDRLAGSLRRIDSLRHELVGAIGYPLLWPAREALAIDRWRLRHGHHLASWIQALGEFEALLSIAGYADENPDHAFAEVVSGEPPLLEADGLGHPLLPADACVRNDLRLGASAPRLHLLSGANMAGKSTWLRTIGLAVVMAQAGVPVRARRLRLTPLSLGVSIGDGDSLLDGESRFLAEIRRLRAIFELTRDATPTLFLLDELLSGTNPHDRIAGASALLEGLASRGAIGLCSTHDLELTRIADRPGAVATNAHFASELANGALRFDYRLRPGVVGRSNALDLMRSVGLEV
jgi:MutS domain V